MNAKTILLVLALLPQLALAGNRTFNDHFYYDKQNNTIIFGSDSLLLTFSCDKQCRISGLLVNGEQVTGATDGIYNAIRTREGSWSTLALDRSPVIEAGADRLRIGDIRYGPEGGKIQEEWTFTRKGKAVVWTIRRTFPQAIRVEEASFPAFSFNRINTWEGAFTGTGGLAWFYLFTGPLFTYGVHSDYAAFWNSQTDNGLRIETSAGGRKIASRFSRSQSGELVYGLTVSDSTMIPRYDADTHRRRFIRTGTDVWSGFGVPAGSEEETIILTPFRYRNEYGRGRFAGIDGNQVTSVLNTIARIGVIDSGLYGGNSWHTPYGPVCLHEQYIAQFGIGINDDHYLEGYKACLDNYRDHAIRPDGRVIARWAYDNSDAMPGTVVPGGFYEAQWGYLMDSNPDYVINVAELFDQCGDTAWVAGQREACEKALDFLIKRDANGNHLVEMMTDNHTDRKGSDWIDIIWASWENAFVNAELYRALILWSDIEKLLAHKDMANYYLDFAARLKTTYNKPVEQGGFWDGKNQCYVHWRDKDGSIHGRNLVTPVNFMAIAYGLCDDDSRRKAILDGIESQMEKENLFFWPICLFSYEPGEGNDWQFPFPNYENGDIFLSWGSVAVQAYADYNPELALKYIRKVLACHQEDGLAFQRYGRLKQDGLGDDILAGNSMAVVGLYHSIYGIDPRYNRFHLDPHLPAELSGTEIRYRYRDNLLRIGLDTGRYTISNGPYGVTDHSDFGYFAVPGRLSYFRGSEDTPSLVARTRSSQSLKIAIEKWGRDERGWSQSTLSGETRVQYEMNGWDSGKEYFLEVEGKPGLKLKADSAGILHFTVEADKEKRLVRIVTQPAHGH